MNFLDGDSDGVADHVDLCPNTPSGEVVEADGCTDVSMPGVPIRFKATAGPFKINLEWDQNTDDTAGYRIFGGTDQSALTLITDLPSINYIFYSHTGLNASETYYYEISAYDLAGNESARTEMISIKPALPFIWDGPKIVFEKIDGTDWTLPDNQDHLTDNVIIARGNNQGLYNITLEASYDNTNYQSPLDTEWASGTTANFSALNFSSWVDAMGWCPPCNIGNDFVLHLISDDIYIDVKILTWTSGAGAGFSYERGTASPDMDDDRIKDSIDNCIDIANADQTDTDNDGAGDVCDDDDDNDGVLDADDALPLDATETIDTDGDGIGDNADLDDDGDGVPDIDDAFPLDATEDTDTDNDGIGNNADLDDDNDGTPDISDAFPLDPTRDIDEFSDTDQDGYTDLDELAADSDANDSSDLPADNDSDFISDVTDTDDDNDGIEDDMDNCPLTYNPEQEDRDRDGLGDVCDTEQLNVSQTFTPNGDGINDTWVIYNIEQYPNSLVMVFNSWGKQVLSVRNYQNDWDGHYKNMGQNLPDAGSYYYQIDFEGDGQTDQDGWLYLNSH